MRGHDMPSTEAARSRPRARPVHLTAPGRARLRVEGLYGDLMLARRIEASLRVVPGIFAARANTQTGSLLLHFEPGLALESLLAAGGIEYLTPTPAREPSPKPSSEGAGRPSPFKSFLQPRARLAAHARPLSEDATPWHTLSAEKVIERLVSAHAGLSGAEALDRLARHGPNALPEPERRSELAMIAGQFASMPVVLLGASAAVSVLTGGAMDAAVILGVVLINAGIGFFTERQSERTISSLLKGTPVEAVVLRDGATRRVPLHEIVPGDILVLGPGVQTPADARLLNADNLTLDESALTGESLPSGKSPEPLSAADTALGDRANMVYMGTVVTGGSGQAVTVATGEATEIGQIQRLAGDARAPDTPMQRQLDQLSTQLVVIGGVVCVGVFAAGMLRGYGLLPMLKSAVSLAVAAVPEGLPTVATTTLALGIREMRKRRVAVRKLEAVETLGSVQVFCMDKTGTLTENRMRVVDLHDGLTPRKVRGGVIEGLEAAPPHPGLRGLLEAVTLCSDAHFDGPGEMRKLNGSPTENALVELALAQGIDVQALRASRPRLEVRYRAEGRPWMTTVHALPEGGRLVAVKGSPSEVLALCGKIMLADGPRALDDEMRTAIHDRNEQMAGDALRVLAAACAVLGDEDDIDAAPLTWLGLTGLADPLRDGMPELIRSFHAAGVETVMITGDQSATAYAIGRELGLSNGGPLRILDAASLEKVDETLLAALVRDVHVFARVSPKHKLRIVQALQRGGRIVAMTGDGINDGPALKASDIGVAMGAAGTDVARSMADIVLEDDNLHTMTTAIAQGRAIYANIRKTVHFLLATNFSEIEVMLAGILLGIGQPLTPMQLLWLNLASDIFPGLALALEPAEPDVMSQPPRDARAPIISRRDLVLTGLESAIISAGTLGSYIAASRMLGPGAASTVAFNTLTLAQLLHSFGCRSETHGLFSRGRLPANPWLNTAVGVTAAVQFALPYLPPMRTLLGIAPTGPTGLALSLAGAAGPLLVNETIKQFRLAMPTHPKPPGEEPPA